MMAAIFAAIESVPMLLKMVNAMVAQWQLWQLSRIDQQYSSKDLQRKTILSVLTKATGVTDEERKQMLRLLYSLEHNP